MSKSGLSPLHCIYTIITSMWCGDIFLGCLCIWWFITECIGLLGVSALITQRPWSITLLYRTLTLIESFVQLGCHSLTGHILISLGLLRPIPYYTSMTSYHDQDTKRILLTLNRLCILQGDICDFLVSWKRIPGSDSKVEIEMFGTLTANQGYIALGLSVNDKMVCVSFIFGLPNSKKLATVFFPTL